MAHALVGVDLRPRSAPGGTATYGSASAHVDEVINALSRASGPDMGTVQEQRTKGIQALVDAVKTPGDAAKSFDRSVLGRNPYRSEG